MVDESLLEEIVRYGELGEGDVVLEVGAGSGNLTVKLGEHVKVSAVEKEELLFTQLSKRLDGVGNVELIHGDALRIEYPLYNKIVSNLPYSISRRLLERFILEGFELAVLVVQREFADKIVAKPGSEYYRMVSVLAQSTCEIELLRDIPPQAFRPQPKVSSTIVRLRQHWRPPKDYVGFLNTLFSRKNKKLRNILDAPEDYQHMRPGEMKPDEIRELYGSF